jgi:GAF domain
VAVLPLMASNEPVGVLALYASGIEFFHEEEIKLMTDLASDISFALDKTKKRRSSTAPLTTMYSPDSPIAACFSSGSRPTCAAAVSS